MNPRRSWPPDRPRFWCPYGAQGGDFGSGISTALGAVAPERVVGVHVTGRSTGLDRRALRPLDGPPAPVGDERVLTDVSLYWLTATAASSARLHRESKRRSEPCPVPLGVAVFAHGITQSVRPLAESVRDFFLGLSGHPLVP